ncbi:hypothetical protein BZG36_00583 [Bifiguratus adelaidae]|uniref:mRNA-capping enzyme subunit beta n=1 Tax=Bifiguratus adelaidae TaxID=1938954 RepID=A0A261Y7H2_9FUNG|nr:hypothetical protein BZG36_00583 [Bifiguratus adelaidae]
MSDHEQVNESSLAQNTTTQSAITESESAPPLKRQRSQAQLDNDSSSQNGTLGDSLQRHTAPVPVSIPSRLEPSIFNIKPPDDVGMVVKQFIERYIDRPYIEVEAKLGILIDKMTQQRVRMGVMSEAVLPEDDRSCRFVSDMSLDQHRYFNNMLNDLVNKSNAKDYKGARIQYKHTRETDRFYESFGKKLRVTYDQETRQKLAVVEKRRIGNLDVHSPNMPFDYRVSVNVEIPSQDPTVPQSFERNKDRLSYRHQLIKIDLTQVKGEQIPGRPQEVTHELEVEFADARDLVKARQSTRPGEPDKMLDLVQVLLNNIRMLGRKSQSWR